jgi:phage gp45-like
MFKNRIFSLVLIIVLLMSSFSAVFAADNDPEVKILNETGAAFWIEFKVEGNSSIWHQAVAGRSILNLPKGEYTYVYWACGQQNSEWVKIKKDTVITLECKQEKANNSTSANSQNVQYKILNDTGSSFWIEFKATDGTSIWHYANAGRTVADLPKGEYTYVYWACGQQNSEWIKIKKEGTINLACAKTKTTKAAETIGLQINNDTGGSMYLYFTSSTDGKSYEFSIPAGKQIVDLPKGSYSYTFYGCGWDSISGSVKVKAKNSLSDSFYCISY